RAVGLEQRGRMREARSAYSAILEKSADAPEVQRASRLRLSRLDAAAAKASRAPTNENSNIGSAPRPNAGDAQTKLIEQMVSGLDKRLREEGGSVEEWQRLIRSYVVLGRTDDATGVLRRALAAFPDNEAASKTLAAFGKSLGLKAS
ncbi:MAG: tetratricopeptide repeat protein, partial [Pseudomonadota bacterium]